MIDTISSDQLSSLAAQVRTMARAAGREILRVYAADDVQQWEKGDHSPLTAADLAAQKSIQADLESVMPRFPILSEEGRDWPEAERLALPTLWIVDPLDGTKEFLKRNGEFTVNIALVHAGRPILGVVYAPVLDRLYWAGAGLGAWREDEPDSLRPVHVRQPPQGDERPWRVVGSRSHGNPAFDAFIARLPACEIVAMGSSLKLCLVAEGAADIYPRHGPTMEWDTAAAHCIVEQAGGQVLDPATRAPLTYNQRPTLLNPHFIVCAQPDDRFW